MGIKWNKKIYKNIEIQKNEIRINEISDNAKKDIEKALNYKTKKYAYLNFDFN